MTVTPLSTLTQVTVAVSGSPGSTSSHVNALGGRGVVNTTSSGAFVFSRQSVGGDYELHVWDAVNGVRAISLAGLTHTLAGTFFLDNR